MNVRSDNRATGTKPPKRGRGRPLVDDKRRRILDAALIVFADRGFHGTTVPEVAEAAGVGTGTLYRYFENKEALVNEVFRDAKTRLAAALFHGAPAPIESSGFAGARSDAKRRGELNDYATLATAKHWFTELWTRLGTFARNEPHAFRFLEMQDHVPYLDNRSKKLELEVLGPLWLAGKRLRDRTNGPPVDVTIALLWGAFVGLVKASRLGYLKLDDARLAEAGATCWRMIAQP